MQNSFSENYAIVIYAQFPFLFR